MPLPPFIVPSIHYNKATTSLTYKKKSKSKPKYKMSKLSKKSKSKTKTKTKTKNQIEKLGKKVKIKTYSSYT